MRFPVAPRLLALVVLRGPFDESIERLSKALGLPTDEIDVGPETSTCNLSPRTKVLPISPTAQSSLIRHEYHIHSGLTFLHVHELRADFSLEHVFEYTGDC